jgi:hypothetical protein
MNIALHDSSLPFKLSEYYIIFLLPNATRAKNPFTITNSSLFALQIKFAHCTLSPKFSQSLFAQIIPYRQDATLNLMLLDKKKYEID